jgi:hypothetical protein
LIVSKIGGVAAYEQFENYPLAKEMMLIDENLGQPFDKKTTCVKFLSAHSLD